MFISMRTVFSRFWAPWFGFWSKKKSRADVTHLLEPELRPLPVTVGGGADQHADSSVQDGDLDDHSYAEEVTEYISPLQARQLLLRTSMETEDTAPIQPSVRVAAGGLR